MIHTEKRWALVAKIGGERFLLGRYCWPGGLDTEIPTFRTRELARDALWRLTSYHDEAKPVRVTVTIQTADAAGGDG